MEKRVTNFDELFELLSKNISNERKTISYSWLNNSYASYAQSNLTNLIGYIDALKLENNQYEQQIINYVQYAVSQFSQILSYFNSYGFCLMGSLVDKEISLLINDGKTPQFIKGYRSFYLNNTTNDISKSDGSIEGYIQAASNNKSISKANSTKEFMKEYTEIEKAKLDLESLKDEFRLKLDLLDKRNEELVNNLNSDFAGVITKNQNLHNDLIAKGEAEQKKAREDHKANMAKNMLSAPLENWYKSLSKYDGNIYVKNNEKTFDYIAIKKKTAKNDEKYKGIEIRMGKTKLWSIFSVIWAIFGIFLIAGGLAIFINEINYKDGWKIPVIASAASSIMLFIYGYVLKIFVKNWNVSRHIEEEIFERISLTQFYLSLIEDGKISDEHRFIAIQEIFRRINTGMIKEPTPLNASSLVENIIKR